MLQEKLKKRRPHRGVAVQHLQRPGEPELLIITSSALHRCTAARPSPCWGVPTAWVFLSWAPPGRSRLSALKAPRQRREDPLRRGSTPLYRGEREDPSRRSTPTNSGVKKFHGKNDGSIPSVNELNPTSWRAAVARILACPTHRSIPNGNEGRRFSPSRRRPTAS